MGWNQARAETRIRKHLSTVPQVAAGTVLNKRYRIDEIAAGASDQFPNGKATLVEGVHLYGQLLDFEDVVLENKHETERSHQRVLSFLDAHYRVWDSILDVDNAIRVDYHGPRLHAVLTEPAGDPAEQISRAMALAHKLTLAAEQVGNALGFPSGVRFGIDHGSCLAMGTGRALEKDVLFLGAPANHAAKLTSAAQAPGIFLTPNAQRIVALELALSGSQLEAIRKAAQRYRFDEIETAAAKIAQQSGGPTKFQFHRVAPPLAALRFEELGPANSVRMGMACLFADIDGFTAYVDNAIRNGENSIATAVRDIHVLREELNSVLKEDFEGKRVRFIGDCIQGLIAVGDRVDDATESVRSARMCASGMRSSFTVAQGILKTIDSLDLAVGIEYGPVPLTRLGFRGEDSIRCAAGLAVVSSERLQQSIEGGGIRLGQEAMNCADPSIREQLVKSGALMEYADASDFFGDHSSPVIQIIRSDNSARPHSKL